jgi:3-isopropylmalate/(R)-2-methylmalate dehydratase small subunit
MSLAKITSVTGRAVPVVGNDIDTDRIIPARFMKCVTFDGLGEFLFYDVRKDPTTGKTTDHALNDPRFTGGTILLSGANFGCGSSREHAPWALEQYGFRAIIAPSFADIFFNNCYKNGLLPVVLSEADVDKLFDEAKAFPGFRLQIDLENQVVRAPNRDAGFSFEVDSFRKHCLLNGLDDIGLTLQQADKIRAFEERHLTQQPWLGNTI